MNSPMPVACDIEDQASVHEFQPKPRNLMKRLVELHERERQLLAYEIHDGLVQLVTGAQMSFQSFDRGRHEDPEQAEATFQNGLSMLMEGVREARRLIGELRPPMLDKSNLIEAMHDFIFESPHDDGPEVEFFHRIDFHRLSYQLEVGALRIAQEALHNARRHSQSEIVRLEITQEDDCLRIVVRDWGIGFDPTVVPENHYGLESICERAKILGGRANIDSAPGKGTQNWVELPISEDDMDE